MKSLRKTTVSEGLQGCFGIVDAYNVQSFHVASKSRKDDLIELFKQAVYGHDCGGQYFFAVLNDEQVERINGILADRTQERDLEAARIVKEGAYSIRYHSEEVYEILAALDSPIWRPDPYKNHVDD